jgi:hypothetical protein
MQLETNMPEKNKFNEQEFETWLRELGNGSFNDEHDDVILPETLRCSTNDIGDLIDHAYPSINIAQPDDYFKQRCILAPREGEVHEINKMALERFPGPLRDLWSADEAFDVQTGLPEDNFPIEFLHSTTPSGFPLAHLSLKVGCPVILLHDVDPSEGILTGCRGIVTNIATRVMQVRMLSGQEVLVPRIPRKSTDKNLPFQLRRLQFPVALAFAMTIDNALGQTFSAVGIDLRYPCFLRGQLYIALSRGRSPAGIKCIVGTNAGESKTKNVVRRQVASAMSESHT